jgi:hypothetical protein
MLWALVGRYVGLLVCFALGINAGRGLDRVDGITYGRDDGLLLGAKVGVGACLDDGIGVAVEEGRYVGNVDRGRGLDDSYASLLILHLAR